jgi:hypothetical protein
LGAADEPDALGSYLRETPLESASPQPAIDGLAISAEVVGEVLKRYFVVAFAGHVA